MTDTPDLATLFDRYDKAVLAFSGGKDSLVCLVLSDFDPQCPKSRLRVS